MQITFQSIFFFTDPTASAAEGAEKEIRGDGADEERRGEEARRGEGRGEEARREGAGNARTHTYANTNTHRLVLCAGFMTIN